MELIDKETAYKELSEYYHHTTFIQHQCLAEALDKVPVVDAVPIDWLIQKQNEHTNDGFEWIYDEIINEWEREKQK